MGTTAFGGLYGGEVQDFAVNAADSRIVLAATTQGIFRTIDSGEQWLPASTGLRHVRVKEVTFDAQVSTIAYAGTDAGVFRSVDGGLSWALAYATGDTQPRLVDPVRRVVATNGAVYASTYMLLLASHDQGVTWSVVYQSEVENRVGLGGMGAAPSDPDVVYLARSDDNGLTQLMRSGDGGATWTLLPITSVWDVEVDPLDPDVAYVISGWAVVVTRDGGASWKTLWSNDVFELALGPGGTILISGDERAGGRFIARSDDAGASWSKTRIAAPNNDRGIEALDVDPAEARTVYYGTFGMGISRSDDGAATFVSKNVGLTAQPVKAFAPDPTDPKTMYASLGYGGLFRSDDGGTTWDDASAGMRDPSNPYRAFNVTSIAVGADGAVYVMRELDRESAPAVFVSTDRAQTWTRSEGLALDHWPGFLFAHPTLPGHVFATSSTWHPTSPFDRIGRSFRTEDGGQTWSEIPGLDDAVTAATIEAGSGRLLAATDGPNERLLESLDFGLTWRPLTFPLPGERVYSLAVDARTGRLYAGGYWQIVTHSDDGGMSWRGVWIGGMERPLGITVIAVDPLDPTQVFAGTGGEGLWFSRDRGQTWAPTQPGVRGHSTYAVMFPYGSAAPAATGAPDHADADEVSIFLRHRAAYVGSGSGTRSGLTRMLPRPHNRRRPTIAGTPNIAQVLTCEPRRWTRTSGYEYRWLRAGTRIRGATSAQYAVVSRDRGQRLKCRVVASGPGGRDYADSRGLLVP